MMLYGKHPENLGVIGDDIDCSEMMFYLYLPIKTPGNGSINFGADRQRLLKFLPIIERILIDLELNSIDVKEKYIYLTAKTLFVSPESNGQRPGWHSDGFMSNDLNYVWSDQVPTVFSTFQPTPVIQHHELSLEVFNKLAKEGKQFTLPNKSLVKMDESVIHKSDCGNPYLGIRTFLKISVSDKIYAQKGNSKNSSIDLGVKYLDRKETRNCPITN